MIQGCLRLLRRQGARCALGLKDRTMDWPGILAGLTVIALPLCIVVCLAAIQVFGSNANTTFQTVGSSIGTTGS